MTAAQLLERLRDRGVTVAADAGDLVFGGRTEELTPRVVETLRAAKPVLLELLSIEAEADGLIAAAYRYVGEEVPGGVVPWADQFRPELMAEVDEAAAAIQAAHAMHDLPALEEALARFVGALRAVAEAYAPRNA